MNDLNRMRKLAGILTEGVMSIPRLGESEAEMQTAATNGVNSADAEFDASQSMSIDEMFDTVNEGAFKEVIQQMSQRLSDLMDSFVDPAQAVDMIQQELLELGHSDDDIEQILTAVDASMNSEDEGDDQDDTCRTCDGTGIGRYGDPDTSRCSSCGGSGVTQGEGDMDDFNEPDEYDRDDEMYEEAKPLDKRTATALQKKVADQKWKKHQEDDKNEKNQGAPKQPASVDEAFDLNNGYDELHFATPGDFFPDGADSPVISATGAAGARQGDNPEQKKIAVAETHKELVYNYRNFLKESSKK